MSVSYLLANFNFMADGFKSRLVLKWLYFVATIANFNHQSLPLISVSRRGRQWSRASTYYNRDTHWSQVCCLIILRLIRLLHSDKKIIWFRSLDTWLKFFICDRFKVLYKLNANNLKSTNCLKWKMVW